MSDCRRPGFSAIGDQRRELRGRQVERGETAGEILEHGELGAAQQIADGAVEHAEFDLAPSVASSAVSAARRGSVMARPAQAAPHHSGILRALSRVGIVGMRPGPDARLERLDGERPRP